MANHTSDSAAQGYYLCSLPRLVLLNIIDRLPAKSATCLGLCSAELRGIAFSDEVWQARCEAKQWEPIQGSWQRGYSNRQRIACRECGRPSKYVFALLGCRLCEKCEHQHPRYSLVTLSEAVERYDVPVLAVQRLPLHVTCGGTAFYLREQVLELAGTSSKPRIAGPLAHVHNGSGGDDEEDEEEDEENEGSGVNMEQQGKQQQAAYDDEVAGADLGGNSSDDCNAAAREAEERRRAEQRSARKANKKQAKEQQRQKRQGMPGGLTHGSPPSSNSINALLQRALHATPSAACRGKQSASAGMAHGSVSPGMSMPGALPAGIGSGAGRGSGRSTVRGRAANTDARDADARRAARAARQAFTHEGDAPLEFEHLLGSSPPQGGFGRRGGGNAGARNSAGSSGTANRTLKAKSAWLAERERLMAEWGEWSISGLVLAVD